MKKTKKMMTGALAAAALVTLSACGDERGYAEPTGTDCDDWDWDSETGTYYCDDSHSTHAGGYYHGGKYYNSKNSLQKSADYKSYVSNYKSGIGSGSKGGFGG
ncbi:hypothetical protein LAV72_15895 [Lysinibacillus xylanilyticus]|uniref:hypothetical protein n=1 Tax=Lysinibacillus TaxID=400634 RepID=UPI002B240389|nr:hypothetical protein [Lysinibacillus xylanilyticus]MEB2301102.1 hypothetical protein [Lysinibacillus xylanilyticus]